MSKHKKKKIKKKIKVAIAVVVFLIVLSSSVLGYLHNRDAILTKTRDNIEEQIDNLYQNRAHTRLSPDITLDKIDKIKDTVSHFDKSDRKTALWKEINITETLFQAYDSVQKMLLDHIIIDDMEQKDIDLMQDKVAKAGKQRKAFLSTIEADVMNISQQFHDIQEAYRKIEACYQEDGKTLKESITSLTVEEVKNFMAVIRNKKALTSLNTSIEDIQKQIKLRDDAVEQAQQNEALAKQAYVVLDVPFINQTAAGAPQGCEAASLLMALRYKGVALDIGYYDFMDGIPVADDPNEGFVHSQYDNHPTDAPHTIYPAPLANYGSKFGTVVDISGSTPEQLRQELYNGNPVILYIVSGFKTPNWVSTPYGKDILNMHVVTLIGYNDRLQKYLINDPYYGAIWVAYDKVDASYQTRNYAVSVR